MQLHSSVRSLTLRSWCNGPRQLWRRDIETFLPASHIRHHPTLQKRQLPGIRKDIRTCCLAGLSWKVVPRLCNDMSGMAKRCKERNTPQTAFDAFVVRAVSGLPTSARSQACTFQTSNFCASLVLSQKPIDAFVLFLHVSFVSHAWSKLFGFWSIS